MPETDPHWADAWLDDVASGVLTMSQRALSTIEAKGGLAPVIVAAQARGLHLVQLTDDTGKTLVAASREPFITLC
jgi:hypothetical protein